MAKEKKANYNMLSVILVIVFCSVCYLIFGILFSGLLTRLELWSQSAFLTTLEDYLVLNLPLLVLFLAELFSSNFILKVPLRDLVTQNKIRSSLFFFPLLITVAVEASFMLLQAGDIGFYSGVWKERLLFLPLVLVITPLQCVAEEIFYRVLPARLVLKDNLETEFGNIIVLSIFSGVIFLIPHMGSSEFGAAGSVFWTGFYYVSYGFLAMLLSLYTKGFECAIGIHAGVNLFACLFSSYESATLTSYPLFTLQRFPSLVAVNLQLYLIFILTLLLLTQRRKRGLKTDDQKTK